MVLLRNSYYFGDAFWSVYEANSYFHTPFLEGDKPPSPVVDVNVVENSAPLGLIQFNGFEQTVVCFVFTLSPSQSWSMLEGGFSATIPPANVMVYDLIPLKAAEFCIKYDPASVKDWDEQTGTSLGGFSPNPSTFSTWLFQAEGAAPYRRLFAGDSVVPGRCGAYGETAAETRAYEGGLFPPVFPQTLSPPLNP